jgi:hypothetical protein
MLIQKYKDKFFGAYLTDVRPYDNYQASFYSGGCSLSLVLAIDPSQNMSFAGVPSVGQDASVVFNNYSITGKVNEILNLTVDSQKITFGENGGYQYTDKDYSNYKFIRITIQNTVLAPTTSDPILGQVVYKANISIFNAEGYIVVNTENGNNYTGSYDLIWNSNNYAHNLSVKKHTASSGQTFYDAAPTILASSDFSALPPKGSTVSGSASSGGSSAVPVPTTTTTTTTGAGSATTTVPATPTPPPPPPSIKAYNAQISNCGAVYIKGGIIRCVRNAPTQAIIHLVEDANAGSFKYPGNGAAISFYIDGISFKGTATNYKRYNASSEPIAIYELLAEATDDLTISDKLLGDPSGPTNVNVYINENGTQDAILNANGISFGTSKFEYITAGFLNNPPTNYGTSVSWNSFAQNASSLSISSLVYKSHTYVGPNVENLQFDKTVTTPVINVYAKTTSSTAPASIPSPTAGGTSSTTTTTTGTGSSAVTTTTTSNLNAFGAGTVVTVSPNLQNLPGGTTTTTEVVNGLTTTTTVTVDVLANKVTKTVSTTFKPSLNSNPGMAQKRRSLMGIPNDFQGAIDPTIAFPSVQIPPKFGNSQSGVFFQANVSPTSFDLDPYFFFTDNIVFQTGVDKQLRPLYGSGNAYKNDFSIVAKDGYSDGVNINIKKVPYNNNVRSMGIRGPVILSGWGYDSRGLPVPNGSNETVQTGVYTDPKSGKQTPLYGLDPSGQYKFNPKTPTRRNLWKTGPVDLRWHEERKVWVGGQEMLEGYLLEDLSPNGVTNGASAIAKMSVRRVINDKGLVGQNEFITVTSRDPNLSASSGAYIMVVDINYEWRPIYVGC